MVTEMTPKNMMRQEPLFTSTELVDEMIDSREPLNNRLSAAANGLLPNLMQGLIERKTEVLMRRTLQQTLRNPQVRRARIAASATWRAAA
jgi:hypothetical protein